MIPFYCIEWDFNRKDIVPRDIMPRLVSEYEELMSSSTLRKVYGVPTTFDEFKEFVKRVGRYYFWAKCEYEIIVAQWPEQEKCAKKIDIFDQMMMNIDLITKIFIDNVSGRSEGYFGGIPEMAKSRRKIQHSRDTVEVLANGNWTSD